MLGKGGDLDAFHKAWIVIWSMDIAPKVKHFLWRLCSNTLPTRELLHHRHLLAETLCPWCEAAVESSAHALVHYPRVQELWVANEGRRVVNDVSRGWCDVLASWKNLGGTLQQHAASLMWCKWHERNKKIFENSETPNAVISAGVERLVMEQNTYSKQVYAVNVPRSPGSAASWRAPPPGVLKVNSDASLAIEGRVGLGVVARDEKGDVIFATTRRVRAWWPPEIAECKALLLAIKLAKRYGLANVILESDSQVLVKRLSKAVVFYSDFDCILEDILSFCCWFESVVWSHVKRGGNYVAHHLAKLVPFGVEQIWENHCPVEISPYILSDTLALS